VPAHPILIPHNESHPPPQLIKQQQQPKTNSISIEKISAPQQDFTIHRRLLSAVPSNFAPGQLSVYPDYIAQNRDFPNK
jgi:hypothetical protein